MGCYANLLMVDHKTKMNLLLTTVGLVENLNCRKENKLNAKKPNKLFLLS